MSIFAVTQRPLAQHLHHAKLLLKTPPAQGTKDDHRRAEMEDTPSQSSQHPRQRSQVEESRRPRNNFPLKKQPTTSDVRYSDLRKKKDSL